MNLRAYRDADFDQLLELTTTVFGPYYEETFRSIVGDAVFIHQHGNWRQDYRTQLTGLHDPEHGKHVVVAERDQHIAGFSAWNVDASTRHGAVEFVAVHPAHRRSGLARSLCEHAFEAMRRDRVAVVEIGTGGDDFHAPARELYAALGMTPLPVTVFFKQL